MRLIEGNDERDHCEKEDWQDENKLNRNKGFAIDDIFYDAAGERAFVELEGKCVSNVPGHSPSPSPLEQADLGSSKHVYI